MGQLALAAGFGSVRRFNVGIRNVYHRTPTQLRHLARQRDIQPGNQYLFRLNFRPPYHWAGMLAFLAARATPGVELVDAEKYRRTISWQGHEGYFEVSLDPGRDALLTRIEFGDPHSLIFIVERIRKMFDLGADWSAIAQTLKGDPVLGRAAEMDPGVRVPGCWNGFELAIRAILGQQITVKGATALAGRMAKLYGKPFGGGGGLMHLFPTPEALAEGELDDVGLTGSRIKTIRELARAVCDGKINFDGVANSDVFLSGLCEIPGIGDWTAQYVAMRALGEPDAMPSSDLGLLRALDLRSSRALEQRAEAWRPWRAYAAMYLWRMGSESRFRKSKSGSRKPQERSIGSTGSPQGVPLVV